MDLIESRTAQQKVSYHFSDACGDKYGAEGCFQRHDHLAGVKSVAQIFMWICIADSSIGILMTFKNQRRRKYKYAQMYIAFRHMNLFVLTYTVMS